jgi:hypothetical protein
MYKKFFLFFSFPFFLQSQFSINLNEKKVNFCFSDVATVDPFTPSLLNKHNDSIGASLTILNGIPPFQFKWIINDTSYFYQGRIFTASYYLYDTIKQITKIRKDRLIGSHNDSVIIYLYVTDSLNRIAKDSLILNISQFKKDDQLSTLCSNKDTNKISAVIGGTFVGDVYSYKWTPKDYLLDDTLKVVRTLTKVPITYICEVTNKYKCKASTFVKVIDFDICSNNIEELEVNKQIVNFHSVIKNNSSYNFIDRYEHYVNIFNMSGRKVYDGVLKEKIPIGSILSEKGVYFMLIDDKSYKIIKE